MRWPNLIKDLDFRKQALLIATVTGLAAGALGVFGWQALERIVTVENRWAEYSRSAVEADQLLHGISSAMGYGGLIHNFKNYILREDKAYLAEAERNGHQIDALILQLKPYLLSDDEHKYLDTIEETLNKYVKNLEVAKSGFAKSLASLEVDTLVVVDDRPAFEALRKLESTFLLRTKIARERTLNALNSASKIIIALFILVPFILLLGLFLILFLKRIVDANKAAEEHNNEMVSLLQSAPDAILNINNDGTIFRANKSAEDLFGYNQDELMKMQVEDLIPDRLRTMHKDIRKNSFEKKSSRSMTASQGLLAKTSDGREVPVEISLSFYMRDQKRAAIVILRDVTERYKSEIALKRAHEGLEKRVEQRTAILLRTNAELEHEIEQRIFAEKQLIQSSKMATIGEMSSGIAHELNQPMNIIRMSVEAELLKCSRGKGDLESMVKILSRVESQVTRMSEIINHMRVFSRDDDDVNLAFDPAKSVKQTAVFFEQQSGGDGINLELNVSQHSALVMGHPLRLEQVILNLISNARDAVVRDNNGSSTKGGNISVSMINEPEDDGIVIEVRDSGGGIDADVLPHIFAPFVTTKEVGEGTGLGLSISYGIIQSMGGSIEAKNENDGACFRISLPKAPAGAPQVKIANPDIEAEQSKANAKICCKLKILVVDDEEDAAASLAEFFEDMGHQVYVAYNGEEALHIFNSDPTDVLITDIKMPVMDGLELIRRMRVNHADLPIFAMTGHSPFDADAEVSYAHATEVWKKPLSLNLVAKRLAHHCGEFDTLDANA